MVDTDPFGLQRFVDAQAPVYAGVLTELRAARKRTHWIWFVFPQLGALGRSATARHFGISGLAEARAYLAHPVLGARLRECTQLLLGLGPVSVEEVFGWPDQLKVASCMTLFERAGGSAEPDFAAVLDRFYAGRRDPLTVQLLSTEPG